MEFRRVRGRPTVSGPGLPRTAAGKPAGRIARWILVGWLASGAAFAADKAPAGAVPAREPVIRHLAPRRDAADLQRIRHFRGNLPLALRWRGNFAWARAEIVGLDKKEYFAHSRIQNLAGLSAAAARRLQGISLAPDKDRARFETLFVDYRGRVDGPGALPRWFDTEYKILEDLAARLPDASVRGTVRLYSNLEPCPSCRGVMRQFLACYTNVELLVLYEWPP